MDFPTTVEEMLAIDNKYRLVGATGDLRDITAGIEMQKWTYPLPSVTTSNRYNISSTGLVIPDIEKLWQAIGKKVDMSNLVLAGGSVAYHLTGRGSFSDLDFFIYGLKTPEEATERALRLIEDLEDTCQYGAIIDRSRGAISLHRSGIWGSENKPTIQIILRLYTSIEQILHGFDLGCCAVGFDGSKVWTTTRGEFCIKNSINVVDTTRRSLSFETRLHKYLLRGYEIVFPKLDMEKVRALQSEAPAVESKKRARPQRIDLATMIINFERLEGNAIIIDEQYGINLNVIISNDYDSTTDEVALKHGECYRNMKALYHAEKTQDGWLMDPRYPLISTVDMEANPDDWKQMITTVDVQRIEKTVLKWWRRLFNKLRQELMCCRTGSDYAEKMLQARVRTSNKQDLHCGLLGLHRLDFLAGLQRKEEERIKEILNDVKDKPEVHDIKWKLSDPGSQNCGSFNPVIEEEQEFYLEYYLCKKPKIADE